MSRNRKRRFIVPNIYDGGGWMNGVGNIAGNTVMPGYISSIKQYRSGASDNAKLLGDEYVKRREKFNKTSGIIGMLGLNMANNIDDDVTNIEDRTANVLKTIKMPTKSSSLDESLANYNAFKKTNRDYYYNYDFHAPSVPERFLKSLGKGATTGLAFGPIGGAIGTLAGFGEFVINGIPNEEALWNAEHFGRKAMLNKYDYADQSHINNINNVNTRNNIMQNTIYSAYGGPLGIGLNPVSGPIDYMQNEELMDIARNNKLRNNNMKVTVPSFAFGGDMMSNGSDWDNGLTYIGNGGSHEENPLGGVVMGMSEQGPNYVEEGEYVWTNSNDEKYVFSNRLMLPEEAYSIFGLKKSKKGYTFADVAEKIDEESSERPNDPISKRGREDLLYKLMQIQEEVRQLEAQRQQMEEQMNTQQNELEQMSYALGGKLKDDPKKGKSRGSGSSSGGGVGGQWPDVDYIRHVLIPPVTETFDDAFARHKKVGDKTFWFNGELYSTKVDPNYKGNRKAQSRRQVIAPALDEREVYTKDGKLIGDSTSINPYIGQPIGWTERDVINNKEYLNYIGDSPFNAFGGHIFSVGGPFDYEPEFWNRLRYSNPEHYDVFKEAEEYWKSHKDEIEQYNSRKNTKDNSKPLDEGDGEGDRYYNLPTSGWQTKAMYAPILGTALSSLYSYFNKPDYAYEDELNRFTNAVTSGAPRVSAKPLGHDYLLDIPFDRLYYANELGSNLAANRRSILNMGNGNWNKMINALYGAAYNDNVDFGKLYRQGEEFNLDQRQKKAELHKSIDQYNSSSNLQAQIANQSVYDKIMALKLDNKLKEVGFRMADDQNYSNGLSNNLTALFNNLGDFGRYYNDRYLINALIKDGAIPTLGDNLLSYLLGKPVEKTTGAYGGKIKTKKRKRGLTI